MNAEDLQIGEQVQQLDGSYGVVISLQHIFGIAVRYNLTVQDDHTYAVGTDQWVVHNCTVYRRLRLSENPSNGLLAKNPDATKSVRDHILLGSKPGYQGDQYISTTKNPMIAIGKYTGAGVVAIDVGLLDAASIIDVSTGPLLEAQGITWLNPATRMAYSYALHDQEVLILRQIPPEAIRELSPEEIQLLIEAAGG